MQCFADTERQVSPSLERADQSKCATFMARHVHKSVNSGDCSLRY